MVKLITTSAYGLTRERDDASPVELSAALLAGLGDVSEGGTASRRTIAHARVRHGGSKPGSSRTCFVVAWCMSDIVQCTQHTRQGTV